MTRRTTARPQESHAVVGRQLTCHVDLRLSGRHANEVALYGVLHVVRHNVEAVFAARIRALGQHLRSLATARVVLLFSWEDPEGQARVVADEHHLVREVHCQIPVEEKGVGYSVR